MICYRFKATPEIREAIYAALCRVKPSHWHKSLSDLQNITHETSLEVTLSDVQISAVLSGLQAAIEAQSADSGDWLRATQYMRARDYLISETRKQFRSI